MFLRTGQSLRDARHLDKYLYTLGDPLFYESLEVHYEPTEEYLNVVKNVVEEHSSDWMITRDGLWFHTHPKRYTLPTQEWKVHVSATFLHSVEILKRAARVALLNEVPFKFALDAKILGYMGSKRWHRGGSGKFITMYPVTSSRFNVLLEQLYAELQSFEGPYILSDKRYKDCRVLYYRYGGMKRTTRMGITGEKTPVIFSPEGESVADVRNPYFAPPPWVTDPFPSQKKKRQELTLDGGKYIVKRAFAFSNSGGVYLAVDRDSGKEVVIKEARPHTVQDGRGQDAVKRLEKEHLLLELLQDTGITPQPLRLFREWEHLFLVEEYVGGVDLRQLVLTNSPLMRVRNSLEDGRRYYEMYTVIVKNLAKALTVLHERRVVFGDLSPNNFRVDASTYAVRLIDFEVAMRSGVDKPSYFYTPGFKKASSILEGLETYQDDLYGLASLMLYMLFPIAAISSLRDDLFDTVLKVLLTDIGWSETPLFDIIRGLSKDEIDCARASELLDDPARISAPSCTEHSDAESCEKITQELGAFLLAHMRSDSKESLFPADPFTYQTNFLSLGFGACGVLYALTKCGLEIPKSAYEWLEQRLDQVKPEDLAPGLFTGSSGIAWVLSELGLDDRAVEFIHMANESAILKHHHSYLYGMAGVGMANLHFYLRSRQTKYLALAIGIGDSLLVTAQESDRGIHWEADKLVHLGYGYGQSGVALFLMRLYQLSGNKRFLSSGKRALEFDLSHGVEMEEGVLSFPHSPGDMTLLPYLEEGSAGIAKVAMRYGIWDRMERILSEVHRKYAGFAGLFYGLGSMIDVLTDAFLFSKDTKYLKMARRPVAGIQDLYVIKQPYGSATPGDGLFRVSCDYATGVAGVMRALNRFTHHDEADFVLDDVVSAYPDMPHSAEISVRARGAAPSAL